MRGRFWLAGIGLLLVAGCSSQQDVGTMSVPGPTTTRDPAAAAAGGVCRLLTFDTVEKATGIRFDVAAAGKQGKSQTCVIRSERAIKPDLTLAVSRTSIDLAGFKADVVPRGAKMVKGLGQAGYQGVTTPKEYGPAAEVGWLTKDGQLAVLRYHLPAGQGRTVANEISVKLVTLAKQLQKKKL